MYVSVELMKDLNFGTLQMKHIVVMAELTQLRFYGMILCWCGICYGPVSLSVCPSVCDKLQCSLTVKTTKLVIMQTMLHGSQGTLVLRCQRS